MVYGAVGTERKIWILLKELALLMSVSLALTPAFKMKFWNLGGEGQILMGAWATALCMIYMGDVIPSGLLILICLAAALICGALWAMIPAFFKARWNTNETLFTLMMNYVALQLVAYFIIIWEVPKGSGQVGYHKSVDEKRMASVCGNQQLLLVTSSWRCHCRNVHIP